MEFDLNKSLEILTATPDALIRLTKYLSDDWIMHNEGGETWSVFDVVGHLIHGEKTDWMVRIQIIISDSTNKEFKPFDRFAQFQESKGKSFEQLLNEFKSLREMNIKKLEGLNLKESDFTKTGIHPKFGAVTLSQLISAWAVHDLGHISQISRVMAKQYKEQAGPWIEYLQILQQ
ncbi:MAG TPA: DinB family protein [Puia sp.]|nr:DinB family protein [Puia sp.]